MEFSEEKSFKESIKKWADKFPDKTKVSQVWFHEGFKAGQESKGLIALPDELAKCQLCGTSEMIICMQKDKTIKGLKVTENKIICLLCIEEQARQDERKKAERFIRKWFIWTQDSMNAWEALKKGEVI